MRRNNRDLARYLLENGADPEAIAFSWHRDGQTPLEMAAERDRTEIAALLKDMGARR